MANVLALQGLQGFRGNGADEVIGSGLEFFQCGLLAVAEMPDNSVRTQRRTIVIVLILLHFQKIVMDPLRNGVRTVDHNGAAVRPVSAVGFNDVLPQRYQARRGAQFQKIGAIPLQFHHKGEIVRRPDAQGGDICLSGNNLGSIFHNAVEHFSVRRTFHVAWVHQPLPRIYKVACGHRLAVTPECLPEVERVGQTVFRHITAFRHTIVQLDFGNSTGLLFVLRDIFHQALEQMLHIAGRICIRNIGRVDRIPFHAQTHVHNVFRFLHRFHRRRRRLARCSGRLIRLTPCAQQQRQTKQQQ